MRLNVPQELIKEAGSARSSTMTSRRDAVRLPKGQTVHTVNIPKEHRLFLFKISVRKLTQISKRGVLTSKGPAMALARTVGANRDRKKHTKESLMIASLILPPGQQ